MNTISLVETWLDYPSPDGCAIAVVMTGCPHHCRGCHSPDLQKYVDYAETDESVAQDVKNMCLRANTNKIVLTGGDCLSGRNREVTKAILRELGETHEIVIYTGYSIEDVKGMCLQGVTYYKCGKYDDTKLQKSDKTENYMKLASTNQGFYNAEYELLSQDGILNFINKEKEMEKNDSE